MNTHDNFPFDLSRWERKGFNIFSILTISGCINQVKGIFHGKKKQSKANWYYFISTNRDCKKSGYNGDVKYDLHTPCTEEENTDCKVEADKNEKIEEKNVKVSIREKMVRTSLLGCFFHCSCVSVYSRQEP